MLDLTNNKQKEQLCILIVRRKRKKHKQSIIDNNPTIVYLHESHYVEESIAAHLVRR
jgi:hypothetical protein